MIRKVLVVDDEPEVAQVIVEALTNAGCSCVHARDAEEADRLLAVAEPIGAVTLDVCLPGRDGLEWLEALHASRPEVARRTLVVTGTVLDERARRRLLRCGAGLLHKPFALQALVREVRSRISAGEPLTPVPD